MDHRFDDLPTAERETRFLDFARAALSLWPREFGDLSLVKYRENAVFSATRDDGVRVALRVHRPGYHSGSAVLSELMWMQALGAAGIAVPEVVPMRAGALCEAFCDTALPEPRLVDMLTWLEGTPVSALAEKVSDPQEFGQFCFDAGVLAARLHDHAALWTRPDGFERLRWDADGLVGEEPLWGRFWELPALDDDQAALLARTRIKAHAELRAMGEQDARFGLIHADLIPDNLLHHERMLRPIDFDDSGFGWHLFDIATILFAYLDEPFYESVEDALFAGYRSVRALDDSERARLPLFMLLRSLTYLGWIQTRADTAIAQDLAPLLIDRACRLATRYTQDKPAAATKADGG